MSKKKKVEASSVESCSTDLKCDRCLPARCCSYMAMQIDNPRSLEDYENLLWYIAHQNIQLFVDDGDWYLNIQSRCNFLGADNRCTIYHKRPQICRDYKLDDCEFEATLEDYEYDHYFANFEQLELFVWKKYGRRYVKDALPPAGWKRSMGPLKKKATFPRLKK